ncbi:MAG: hypothetical protein RR048_00470 [Oscillospiraceae bacterium]
MTRSKFNSKFRMSGIRSMIFILIFVALIIVPIGFAVKALTPEEYISPSTDQDTDVDTENNDDNDVVDIGGDDNEETDNPISENEDDQTEENGDEATDGEQSADVAFDKKAKNGLMPGVAADAFDNIDEGKFVYVVNKSIALKDGKSEANILIYNPKQNGFNLSLKISVNGKSIYETGILKPNQYIENDVFNTELSKGEYDADIEVVAYDKDTNEKQEVYNDNIKITVTK